MEAALANAADIDSGARLGRHDGIGSDENSAHAGSIFLQ